jgi:predicted RNase H-like nuclease
MPELQTLHMNKKMFVGVDGCKAGWFAVALTETNSFGVFQFSKISDLWNYFYDGKINVRILVDIPIGLIDSKSNFKRRSCDVEARRILRPYRQSSVFPIPCREAIYAKSYESACDINEEITGKRLTKQTWGIVPKIREMNDFLIAIGSAKEKIIETHPEVCFWALVGKPMEYSKKESEGFDERKQLLQEICTSTDEIVQNALSKYRRKDVARDDILDALVASVTVKLSFQKRLKSIPEIPEKDSQGLPMQVVYTTVC